MTPFAIHPEIDQDSMPFWQSVREGSARLQKCSKCGKFRFPPSASCYHCGTLGGEWTPISGKGTLYSWIVVHHPVDKRLAPEVPFVVAMVDLEEGPRVAGRLVGAKPGELKAGLPVRIRYDVVDSELTLMDFEPAS